jgi:hypothetical protein
LGLKTDAYAQERLEIYRDAYKTRIKNAVAVDFPGVKKALGAKSFEKCLDEMIKSHPSTFKSLSEVSVFFPRFLKSKRIKNKKYISALAEFEWLKLLSELDPKNQEKFIEISNISEEHINRARFILAPSVRLFFGDWTVNEKKIRNEKTRLLIFLSGDQTKVMRLEKEEFLFLSLIQSKMSFKQILKNRGLSKLTPVALQSFLAKCVQDSVIIGFQLKGEGKRG